MSETPFDCIESAQEYIRLLASQVGDVRAEIGADLGRAEVEGASRRADALHIVEYKLRQLAHHLDGSRRILNDLRLLRRLLTNDDDGQTVAQPEPLLAQPDAPDALISLG